MARGSPRYHRPRQVPQVADLGRVQQRDPMYPAIARIFSLWVTFYDVSSAASGCIFPQNGRKPVAPLPAQRPATGSLFALYPAAGCTEWRSRLAFARNFSLPPTLYDVSSACACHTRHGMAGRPVAPLPAQRLATGSLFAVNPASSHLAPRFSLVVTPSHLRCPDLRFPLAPVSPCPFSAPVCLPLVPLSQMKWSPHRQSGRPSFLNKITPSMNNID
jgi:hypothetical protein